MEREGEAGRGEDGQMTSRTGLVKQNSGRVFTVGEGQTTMETVGT